MCLILPEMLPPAPARLEICPVPSLVTLRGALDEYLITPHTLNFESVYVPAERYLRCEMKRIMYLRAPCIYANATWKLLKIKILSPSYKMRRICRNGFSEEEN